MTDPRTRGFNAAAAPFVPGGGGYDGSPVGAAPQMYSVFGQQQNFLHHQPQQHHQHHGFGGMDGGGGGQMMGGGPAPQGAYLGSRHGGQVGGGFGGGGQGQQQGYGHMMMMAEPQPMALPPHLHGLSIEVYDGDVKAQIALQVEFLYQTQGALAAIQQAQNMGRGGQGGRGDQGNKVKVCSSFAMHGNCRLSDTCRDIHPMPPALDEARSRVYAWLQSKEEEFMGNPDALYKVFYSDLKEVISVPAGALAFTRGLFLDPADREKRPGGTSGGTHRANPTIAQQAPTACGLYANNPVTCKWGRFCNQAHVSAEWIENHRRQFEEWSSSLEAQYRALPDDATFVVHDPIRRVLLRVPKMRIASFTRGLLQSMTDKCPSVCLLSLQGRCTAGGRCNQAHIDPVWLGDQSETADAVIDSATGAGIGGGGSRSDSHHAGGIEARQFSSQSFGSNGTGPGRQASGGDGSFGSPQQRQQPHQQLQQAAEGGGFGPASGSAGSPQQQQQQQRVASPREFEAVDHHQRNGAIPPQPVGMAHRSAAQQPQPQQQQQQIPSPTYQQTAQHLQPPAPIGGLSQTVQTQPQQQQTPTQRFSRNQPPVKLSPSVGGGTPPELGTGGLPAHLVSPIRPPGNAKGAPFASQSSATAAAAGFTTGWGTYGFNSFRTPDAAGMPLPNAPGAFGAPGQAGTPNPNPDVPRTPLTSGTRGLSFSFPFPPPGVPGAVSPLMRSTTTAPHMKISLSGFDEVFSGQYVSLEGAGESLTSLPPPASGGPSGAPVPSYYGAPGQPPPTPPNAGRPTSTPSTPLSSAKSPLRGQAPANSRYSPGGRPVASLGAPPGGK
jgi:hypothetical protein